MVWFTRNWGSGNVGSSLIVPCTTARQNLCVPGGFFMPRPPRPHFVTFPFLCPKYPCQTRLGPPEDGGALRQPAHPLPFCDRRTKAVRKFRALLPLLALIPRSGNTPSVAALPLAAAPHLRQPQKFSAPRLRCCRCGRDRRAPLGWRRCRPVEHRVVRQGLGGMSIILTR